MGDSIGTHTHTERASFPGSGSVELFGVKTSVDWRAACPLLVNDMALRQRYQKCLINSDGCGRDDVTLHCGCLTEAT